MAKLITGVFKTRSSATLALEDLNRHGFNQTDISMLMSDTSTGREFVIAENSKSPEGLAIGAAIGGIIGVLILGLTSTGMIANPAGWFYTGQVVAALAGFGAGSLLGGIIGGLIGLSLPEHEALLNRNGLDRAGILVGTYSPKDRTEEVKNLLQAAGARVLRVESVKDEPVPQGTMNGPGQPPERLSA